MRSLDAGFITENLWRFFLTVKRSILTKGRRYPGGSTFSQKFKKGSWTWFNAEIEGKLLELEQSDNPEIVLTQIAAMVSLCYLTIVPDEALLKDKPVDTNEDSNCSRGNCEI